MGEVYRLISELEEHELDARFDVLPNGHPAKAPYNIFKQAGEKVRGGVIVGLGARLQVYQNELIRQITGGNDIDLVLPGKKKCAYFCITSDQDRDLYHVGDTVLAAVTSVDRNEETGQVKIGVDMRQLQKNDVMDKLRHCKLKGKYSGRVVDIHKGVVYLRLDIGVNAIAHRNLDYRQPGRGDIVSFVVNRIDANHGVAVGLLTRIIRQNI